jgi:hypothetical protein
MPNLNLKAVISAEDNTKQAFASVDSSFNRTVKGLAAIAASAFALDKVRDGLSGALQASTKMSNAVLGLQTVAKAFNQDIQAATQAAQSLARDGLMSVSEASEGLKNLLATGFSLPQAIQLMHSFKDAAAFNRQGTLAFGEAIVGATQGIKNQNSIMVDNAGITKNLSLILQEAGYSLQDLSKVTSDQNVRQALYNGLVKEASIFQGDASKAATTYAGANSQLSTSIFNVKAQLGEALARGLLPFVQKANEFINSEAGKSFLDGVTNSLNRFFNFITANQESIFSFLSVIKTMLEGVTNAAKVAAKPFQELGSAIGGVVGKYDTFMHVKDNQGLLSAFKSIVGKRAEGGPVSAGSPYLVGERGPELFVPGSSGQIVPNKHLSATINIYGNINNQQGLSLEEIGAIINRQWQLANLGA